GEVVDLALDLLDVLEQDRDRARDGVRQVTVIEIDELETGGVVDAVTLDDAARDADDGRARRHGMDHDRAGADPALRADRHWSEDGRAGADDHQVLDRRVALLLL